VTRAQELAASGSASLDIGPGNVVAVVSNLTLEMATANVVTGNTAITGLGTTAGTIDAANVLTFTIDGASLFVGNGGSLNSTRDAIETDGALGFSLANADVTFVSVTKLTTSFTGLSLDATDASLVGIEGFGVWVSGTVKLNSSSRLDGQRIDWDRATTVPSTPANLLPALDVDAAIELQVIDGAAAVDAFGFFVASVSDFDLTLARANVVTGNSTLGTLAGASLVSISLGGLDVFVGVGGQLSGASSSAAVVDGSVGFGLSGGSIAVAIVKPAGAAAGDRRSYTGLEIGLDRAQLIGVDGLTFIAGGSALINKATDAAGLDSAQRINWFAATKRRQRSRQP
jgi:hypothetical protein